MELDSLSADKLQTVAKKQASWAAGALRQFSENRCAAMAASIAFYAAFSLAPTLVMVIAISGWFFGAEAARGELFRQVHSVLGNDAAAAVTTIVQNAHRSGGAGGIAAIISFVLLAVGASATFSSLNSALNIVWPSVAPRASSVFALVRVRLISFGLVLGVAFLLIVSLVLDTAITFVGNWIWGDSPYVVIGNLLQLAVGWMVLAFAFAALLKFLPDAPVRWRDALVGGTVAAALFSAGKKLFALYLAHAGMANSFGAAGSLAVLLMWLYFSAVVLLLGAEFAAAVTIVEAGRRAVAADRYVRRHPWESMLIAASTAMAVAALARRCNASNDAETPPSDNASR
jgi:membrane protein